MSTYFRFSWEPTFYCNKKTMAAGFLQPCVRPGCKIHVLYCTCLSSVIVEQFKKRAQMDEQLFAQDLLHTRKVAGCS